MKDYNVEELAKWLNKIANRGGLKRIFYQPNIATYLWGDKTQPQTDDNWIIDTNVDNVYGDLLSLEFIYQADNFVHGDVFKVTPRGGLFMHGTPTYREFMIACINVDRAIDKIDRQLEDVKENYGILKELVRRRKELGDKLESEERK